MAFGVFIHRSDSIYDDSPAERYQFPNSYLGRVQACLGDWIIYYEPVKVRQTRGYFAIAKLQDVVPDPSAEQMHIAIIEPGSYLEFPNPVPYADDKGVVDRGLLNSSGKQSGNKQSSVRGISPENFDRILTKGFEGSGLILPRVDASGDAGGFAERQTPFVSEQPRQRLTFLTSRIERDRVFRQIVLRAYGERCAVTGLKLINGGGRAEVTAAHIRPVEKNGPDIVSNGLALSGTAHWMFDRGLISLTDSLDILISRQANDPNSIRSFVNKSGLAFAPRRLHDRPHPHFLKWHRENCFKQ
jgi:putative restriction endonuclease